jgi:hypothetical protein
MAKINENELGDRMMTGLPYSQGGGLGTPSIDTISSPDISQSPEKFKYPQTAASASDITVPPPEDYDNSPTQSKQDFDRDVDSIKTKVTPDEIIAGIKYELKKMVFKRMDVAKQLVAHNLKKNPKFYSSLESMMVDENGVKKEAIYDIIREMKQRKSMR